MLRFLGQLVSLREKFTETVKAAFGKGTALRNPVGERGETSRLNPAGAHASDFFTSNKPAGLQHLKMLDHCGKCHVERCRQVADGCGAMAQPLQNGPPRRLHKGP